MKKRDSGMHIFSACSAFEFGGDSSRLRGGGITALQYPPRAPRHFRADPFDRAAVRLTRSSLSVYRPTDRAFHCELRWRDVREIRRHPTARGGGASFDFAFITPGAILVLEVPDAAVAEGIAAALEVLDASPLPKASPQRPLSPSAVAAAAGPSAVAGAMPSAVAGAMPSAVAGAMPSAGADGRVRSEALERIRRREEEMREAIFFTPRSRSHSTALRCVSPALRGVSPAPLPLSTRDDGVEDILRVLDEEEARASRAVRTQETRVRGLRRPPSPQSPPSPTEVMAVSDRAAQRQPRQQVERPVLPLPPRPQELQRPEPKGAGPVEREMEQNAPEGRGLFASRPMAMPPPTMQSSTATASLLRNGDVSKNVDAIATAHAEEEAIDRNKAVNEQRRVETQRKAVEDREKLLVGGLSLMEALERERHAAVADDLSAKTHSIGKGESNANAHDATMEVTEREDGSNTGENQEDKKMSGVMYGDGKELHQNDAGKVYSEHITTTEAISKPKPEVLELGKKENIKSDKAVAGNGGTTASGVDGDGSGGKRGALRVSGVWKEFRDPKSGRLYYVNSETKQRTWKVSETTFASV